MKLDPRKWFISVGETIRLFPVEAGIVGFTLVVGVAMVAGAFGRFHEGMAFIPLCFAVAYILNNLFREGAWRWVYRLCWVAMIPVWGSATGDWIESTAYMVAYPCLLLGVLSCRRVREDEGFVKEALVYFYAAAIAGVFASVAYLLLWAIYYSLVYIFGFFGSDYSFIPDFGFYSMVICYGTACPMMLLAFISRLLGGGELDSRMFTTLFNWILTPALLIYTAILYLYFITILVSWSLPKGGIAYMVFAFTLMGVMMGACQPLLKRRLYDWFFGRFSLIVLPALIMFWIGVFYRIREYGLTEARIYLLICGGLMTFALGVLAFKRRGSYLLICTAAFVLLVLSTYIPPISAKRCGEVSQRNRVERIARRLELLDDQGRFVKTRRPVSDTVYKEDYRRIYESLSYLEQQQCPMFGLREADELMEIAPESIENYVRNGNEVVEVICPAEDLSLRGDTLSFDIRGYGSLTFPDSWPSSPDRYVFENDTLRLYMNDTLCCEVSGRELLEIQLQKIGSSMASRPQKSFWEEHAGELLVWQSNSVTVIFTYLNICLEAEEYPKLRGLDIRCVLER